MIRKIARPLLASAFVLDGVQMLKNTGEHTEEAKLIVGNARRVLPPNVAAVIPKDDATSVRLVAGSKIAGAALLGTGKAPRLGAGLLTLLQLPTSLCPATLSGPSRIRLPRRTSSADWSPTSLWLADWPSPLRTPQASQV